MIPSATMRDRSGDVDPRLLAGAILETIPALMRAIRTEMRRAQPHPMSVPEFRTLRFVAQNPGTNLASIAAHLGSMPASSSQLVSRLVAEGLVTSATNAKARREVSVALTAKGKAEFEAAEERARVWLQQLATTLEPSAQARLLESLRDLLSLVESSSADDDRPHSRRV
jgi:DNA-binding MarR family transcriptional regulator